MILFLWVEAAMPELSPKTRQELLLIAREAIQTYLSTGSHLEYPGKPSEELLLHRGCFVTLKKNGELRGCIGTFDDSDELIHNLLRMSVAAAFQDPRFPAVGKQELDQIKIEISVLGPLERIDSIDAIEIGKHGIYVKNGRRSGTYLPDVATEHHMSREEFVMHCAREKAGLSPKECMTAELYRYEVEKFSE